MADVKQEADTPGYEDAVAVVGMAGRFPGAATVEEFWRNLRGGVESIDFFSVEEMEEAGAPPALVRDPRYVPAHGTLDRVEWFDAAFFGFSPREAEIMDPQVRLFLEIAWEALERAGYDAERVEVPVGVFGGGTMNHYLMHAVQSDPSLAARAGGLQGGILNHNFIATWTSYKLGLRGPSLNLQTACSTSLVAVHLAVQSLLAGECGMALAGGASVQIPQKRGYAWEEGGILSPDGHCRAFDAEAGGTVDGSGVGVVVLKRMEDALEDGDVVHAVIRASAVNNDGSLKAGFTAPSVAGQAAVISEALALSRIDPETIGYVECHGTATPLGDPIEATALTQAFRARTKSAVDSLLDTPFAQRASSLKRRLASALSRGTGHTLRFSATGNGLAHELLAAMECLRDGRTEHPRLPLSESVSILETIDRARIAFGARGSDGDSSSR